MGGNEEPLAHGRIWSGPLNLLLPALPRLHERKLTEDLRQFYVTS